LKIEFLIGKIREMVHQ